MANSSDYKKIEASNVTIGNDLLASTDYVDLGSRKPVVVNAALTEKPDAARNRSFKLNQEDTREQSEGRQSLDAFVAAEKDAYVAAAHGSKIASNATARHDVANSGAPRGDHKSIDRHEFHTEVPWQGAMNDRVAAIAPEVQKPPAEPAVASVTAHSDDRNFSNRGANSEFAEDSQPAASLAGGFSQPVTGTEGNDVLNAAKNLPYLSGGYYTFYAYGGNDVVWGTDWDSGDSILGGAGSDVLIGGGGSDTLDGGADFDWVSYRDEGGTNSSDPSGRVGVLVNLGPNPWQILINKTLQANTAQDTWGVIDTLNSIEGVVGTDREDQINAQGNLAPGLVLYGQGGNDTIWGGDGGFSANGDTIDGGFGSDLIYAGGGDDHVYGSMNVSDGAVDFLHGGGGNDTLEGWPEDELWGDAGNNVLIGGKAMYADTAGVLVNLATGTAVNASRTQFDTLINIFQVKATIGNNTFVAGSRAVSFTGGSGNDTMTGGIGNDSLDGGTGTNYYYGSAGNDRYSDNGTASVLDYRNVAGPITIELSSGRITKADGSIDSSPLNRYQGSNFGDTLLGNNFYNFFNGAGGNDSIEGFGGNDDLYGGAGDDLINGGSGNDKLYGEDDKDSLDGGSGADTMQGGNGDDTYYVDDPGDVVLDDSRTDGWGGIDSVYSSVSFSLAGTYAERLYATGAGNISLTGSDVTNELRGNSGNNILDGGAGADSMTGGDGDDTYFIDDLGDLPIEMNGRVGGNDTAKISVQNFDARKLVNIENIEFAHAGLHLNYAPTDPAPTETETYKLWVGENDGSSAQVAKVKSTDDGNGGELRYFLVDGFGRFVIDPKTGIITLQANNPFDYEGPGLVDSNGKKYFELQVYTREEDDDGVPDGVQSNTSTIRIEIQDRNDAPTAITYASMQVAEKAGEATTIGGIPTVSDQDTNENFKRYVFSIADAPDHKTDGFGMFAINPQNGQLSVGHGRFPDYTEDTNVVVRVRVTDGVGSEYIQNVTVTIIAEVNRAPTAPVLQGTPDGVNENGPGFFGKVTAGDDGNGGPLLYRLVSDFGGKIAINEQTGEIYVVGSIDYESDQQLSVSNADTAQERKFFAAQVYARESTGSNPLDSFRTNVNVYVNNVNEKPSAIDFLNKPAKIEAGSVADTLLAKASAYDPDSSASGFAGNHYQFANGSQISGKFKIDPTSGQISLNEDLTKLDEKSYSLVVRAFDPSKPALWTEATYNFTVEADPVPFAIRFDNGQTTLNLDENPTNSKIAKVIASDNGPSSSLRYALVDDPFFVIDPLSGEISLKNGVHLDYEDKKSYQVVVVVTDENGAGRPATRILTINVQDVNERPTDVEYSTTTVRSGTPKDTTFAHVTKLSDPDSQTTNGSFKYELKDPNVPFTINAQTGALMVGEGLPTVPAGTTQTFDITVIVTDKGGNGLSYEETITITITPPNAPPVIDVIPNGHTTWDIQDIGTAMPFHDLIFSDAEEGLTGHLIVRVDFDSRTGAFESVPNGVQVGDGFIVIEGTQQEINNILKVLRFNPGNRPAEAGVILTTDFTITLTDSEGAFTTSHVFVNATASGLDTDNLAPTIVVTDTTPIPAKDWGSIVKPFAHVSITDGDANPDDDLTLTISFNDDDGVLGGIPPVGASSEVDPTGKRIWTFHGRADTLTALLQNTLTFNPKDRDAPGPNIDTQFTITVSDGFNIPEPTVNTQVHVVTTVEGPTGINNLYEVIRIGQQFGEDKNPAIGGIDKALVRDIGGQYVLDTDDGIETLEAHGENAEAVNIKGNNLANLIIGHGFNDTLEGGGVTGDVSSTNRDVLQGGAGDDTYIVNADDVFVDETHNGDGSNDAGGHDKVKLDGAAFGGGWTRYELIKFVEVLDASGSTGVVTLVGNDSDNHIIGNASANLIEGGMGNDTLDGGAGDAFDRLKGGAGDDVYLVRHKDDAVVEANNEDDSDPGGIDTIVLDGGVTFGGDWTSVTMAGRIEKIDASESNGAVTLIGNDLGNEMIGNAASNTLEGLGGNDTLDGGVGMIDRLDGGAGDDLYKIRNLGDVIVDGNGGGSDTAEIYIEGTKYELNAAAQIEHLRAGLGIDGVHLVGNAFSGVITGSDGADTLDGGIGGMVIAHRLTGGLGNDTYIIVNKGDQILGELIGADGAANGDDDVAVMFRGLYDTNQDWLNAKAHYLANGIERIEEHLGLPDDENGGNAPPTNIRFSERFIRENPAPMSFLGNLLADDTDLVTFTLKAGADLGGGIEIRNDREVWVKDATKIDFEQATNGVLSFTVVASDGTNNPEKVITVNVENLLTESVDGTENANLIRSGSGNDNLKGWGGNDTLSGGGGKDVLTGGEGADSFLFDSQLSATANFDRIQDFSKTEGDKILLSLSVFKAQIGVLGVLDADAFVIGKAAQDAEDRIIYDPTSGKLFYDPNGNAGNPAGILFAQLRVDATHPAPQLTFDDFLIVL